LPVDAEHAVAKRDNVQLGDDFRAPESRIALAVGNLCQRTCRATAGKRIGAEIPGHLLEDEILITRVVKAGLEPQLPLGAL
jgi:hypothetical protein